MELGMGEILFILLVALLVYGGRLPQVAAAVGRSIGELRRGLRDTTDMVRGEIDDLADLDPRRAVRRAWDAGPAEARRRLETSLADAGRKAPRDVATEDVSGETNGVDEAAPGPETEAPKSPDVADRSEASEPSGVAQQASDADLGDGDPGAPGPKSSQAT